MNVIMGNDEFILHIRKHYPLCRLSNSNLGKRIWEWIRSADPNADIVERDRECYWRDTGSFIAEDRLPKTATQFSFDSYILPQLFEFLVTLGREEA